MLCLHLVSFAAVIRVVTRHATLFSTNGSGEKRCVTSDDPSNGCEGDYVYTIPDSVSFMPTRKAIRYSMNTYPICDSPLYRSGRRGFAPLQKSRQTIRSYVWTEALFRYGFVAGTKAVQCGVWYYWQQHTDKYWCYKKKMLRRNVQCLPSENFTLAIFTPTFTTLTDLLTPCALFWDVTEHFREGTLSHTRTTS